MYFCVLLKGSEQSAIDALKKTSKRVITKSAETTGHLTGNKVADKMRKVSRTSPQNTAETEDAKIPK